MKILMVCLGNICRSPLAHGILKNKAKEQNIDIVVDSAGTSTYHIGLAPDRRSINIASKHNIDISEQRAREFTREDLNNFDIIYAMDSSNYNHIIQMAWDKNEMNKVKLILHNNRDVPDPYTGGDDGFEDVFIMLDDACNRIINELRDGL
jgi:protein-tyrosine phosphatase